MGSLKETPLGAELLPIEALRAHLRLGTGFGNDTLQDPVLEPMLRAAISTIEMQTAKALISRAMTYTTDRWSSARAQTLPVAPVSAVTTLRFLTAEGGETVLPESLWWLCEDGAAPSIVGRGGLLPTPPSGARIEIAFDAGYGTWDEVPADLRQAVMLLAAHYYEHRSETQLSAGCMPFGVTALLEPYRLRRVGFGAAR